MTKNLRIRIIEWKVISLRKQMKLPVGIIQGCGIATKLTSYINEANSVISSPNRTQPISSRTSSNDKTRESAMPFSIDSSPS